MSAKYQRKPLQSKDLGSVRSLPKAKGNLVQMNVTLPETLRKKWKIAAASLGTTLSELVIEGVEHAIAARQASKKGDIDT